MPAFKFIQAEAEKTNLKLETRILKINSRLDFIPYFYY